MTGNEDLGGGLRAVFRLESGFFADDGLLVQGGRLFGREASVGLSHSGLGTFEFGRLPVPYYRVQNGVDAFVWSLGGGMLATTRTQAGASRQILPTAINARDDNALSCASPNIGGLVFRAQTALSENSATLGNSRGLSARYTSGAVDLVAGWNRQSSGSAGTGEVTAHVFGGSDNFGAARVFGGYTQEANSCSNCTGAFSRVTGVVGENEAKFRIANPGPEPRRAAACSAVGGNFRSFLIPPIMRLPEALFPALPRNRSNNRVDLSTKFSPWLGTFFKRLTRSVGQRFSPPGNRSRTISATNNSGSLAGASVSPWTRPRWSGDGPRR